MEGNKKPELGNYEVDPKKGLQARKKGGFTDSDLRDFLRTEEEYKKSVEWKKVVNEYEEAPKREWEELRSKFFPEKIPPDLMSHIENPEKFQEALKETIASQPEAHEQNKYIIEHFIRHFMHALDWLEKGKEIYDDYLSNLGRGMDKSVDAILKKRLTDARGKILLDIENTEKLILYLKEKFGGSFNWN